jgi:hypothetical protein
MELQCRPVMAFLAVPVHFCHEFVALIFWVLVSRRCTFAARSCRHDFLLTKDRLGRLSLGFSHGPHPVGRVNSTLQAQMENQGFCLAA